MAQASRPLRALTLILGSWVLGRVVALTLPGVAVTDPIVALAAVVAPPADAAGPTVTALADVGQMRRPDARRKARLPVLFLRRNQAAGSGSTPATPQPDVSLPGSLAGPGAGHRAQTVERSADLGLPPSVVAPRENRLSGSLWLLARAGRGGGLATGGQLGASQGGFRVNYAFARAAFATARVSAPFDGPGRQASIGIGMKGKRAGLLVERWVALDRGGRNDFAVIAYGGVDGVLLPAGARLDAYAQAGVVGRDPFADGAVRVEREAATMGASTIAVGIGAWAGAQPGVGRIDIGPQIVARVPVAGRTLRLSTEWRQRVAGQAAPASGPALTLGMDF